MVKTLWTVGFPQSTSQSCWHCSNAVCVAPAQSLEAAVFENLLIAGYVWSTWPPSTFATATPSQTPTDQKKGKTTTGRSLVVPISPFGMKDGMINWTKDLLFLQPPFVIFYCCLIMSVLSMSDTTLSDDEVKFNCNLISWVLLFHSMIKC